MATTVLRFRPGSEARLSEEAVTLVLGKMPKTEDGIRVAKKISVSARYAADVIVETEDWEPLLEAVGHALREVKAELSALRRTRRRSRRTGSYSGR